MLERLVDLSDNVSPPDSLYENLVFPDINEETPYIFANMVCTIDGKTVLGPKGSTAKGLGSGTDQLLMRRIQECSDAAIVGASTIRAGNVIYPPNLLRVAVTISGDLPLNNRFFTDYPDEAVIFTPESLAADIHNRLSEKAQVVQCGSDRVDIAVAMRILRMKFNVRKLLLEGGASLNDEFFRKGLVRELFLTLAPKLKGGVQLPGLMDGEGFEGNRYRALELISLYRSESELYLRYRVGVVHGD